MTELFGWLGLILLLCTLVPFVLRRLCLWRSAALLFSRYHHALALAGAALLTLHGFLALAGRHGWGLGAISKSQNMVLTGILAWLALSAVIIMALTAARRKPFTKTHCRVVILLALLVLIHIF